MVELEVVEPLAGADLPEGLAQALQRPESRETRVSQWIDALRGPEVLARATADSGSAIAAADVRVEGSGSRFEISVAGESGDAATARCMALLRAAKTWDEARRTGPAILWLRDERRRALHDVVATEESLRFVSMDPLAAPAKSFADERAASSTRSATSSELARMLDAEVDRARAFEAELRVKMTDGHPELRDATATTRRLVALAEAQRAADSDWERAYARELDAAERDKGPSPIALRIRKARASATLASLSAPATPGIVTSFAPLGLRLSVLEERATWLEREKRLMRIGANHPDAKRLEAELRVLQDRVEQARSRAQATLREAIAALSAGRDPSPEADPRVAKARAERERLLGVLLQLDELEWRVARTGVDAKVSLPCGAH